MIRNAIIYLFFCFLATSLFSQVPDETAAIVLIHDYIEGLLGRPIDNQRGIRREFHHPDAVLLGGYNPNFFILKGDYEVISVKIEMLNLNLMEPKEEEFIALELSFPAIGRVWLGQFHEENDFTCVFYLNRYNNELKILKRTEQKYFMMSIGDSLDYLKKRNEDGDYYKPAYNDLLAYLEEKEIAIPE